VRSFTFASALINLASTLINVATAVINRRTTCEERVIHDTKE
jgi:hypothetical protein